MIGEQRKLKVVPLVEAFVRQVTSAENGGSANCWSAVRYNANNAWYVNTSNGNVNNNNTYNRYAALPCPLASVDLLFSMMLDAERSCFRNKHSSMEACRVHYHLAELYRYAQHIFKHGLSVGASRCFILDYPVYREVFCAQYYDRIIHHMVAPLMEYVAEKTHMTSGDVSHGNRLGHSAYTAAKDLQTKLRKATAGWTRKAWVATRDYSGFFMSIPRRKAAEMFRRRAAENVDCNNPKTAFLIDVVCLYLMADPTRGCIRLSPLSMWDKVAPNKSMFTCEKEHGEPIGNFPSQIIANLYRADIDGKVSSMPDIEHVVFVDDRAMCSHSKDGLKKALARTEEISARYNLRTNAKKRYMQQADKGVRFCGYVIKCDRIYPSNRMVNDCRRTIQAYKCHSGTENEARLARSINSYFGLMSHTRSYNIQKRFARDVMGSFQSLYFQKRHWQLICRQKKIYTKQYNSIQQIKAFRENENSLLRRWIGHHRREWRTNSRVA